MEQNNKVSLTKSKPSREMSCRKFREYHSKSIRQSSDLQKSLTSMDELSVTKEWKLKEWIRKDEYLWGFKYPKASGEQCTSNKKYCYPHLTKQGTPRWGDLDHWIGTKMFQSAKYKWGDNIDPEVWTGIGGSGGQDKLTWGDIVNKVLNEIEAQSRNQSSVPEGSLIWDKEEWASALGALGAPTEPLDQFEEGRRMLLMIMCIITGLIEGKERNGRIFERRGRVCSLIDTGLEFKRENWDQWIENKGNVRATKEHPCSRTRGTDGCQLAGLALILSVYKSMARVCGECGPYRLTYWIRADNEELEDDQIEFCSKIEEGNNCDNSKEEPKTPQVIIVKHKKMEAVTRQRVFESSALLYEQLRKNSSGAMETGKLVQVTGRENNSVDSSEASGNDDHSPVTTAESNLTRECCASTIITNQQSLVQEDEMSRMVTKNESDLQPNIADSLSHPKVDESTDQIPKECNDSPPQGGLGQDPERGSKESGSGMGNRGVLLEIGGGWWLIIGLAGVLCLAFGSAYGLWRVFRSDRRKQKSQLPSGRGDNYGVAYGSASV
ncbi:hypothetical protein C922_05401 [Plasmodium inui San Antonio 1]|uniref:Uncharacterized protein n=1 Tax=Plasmodium inui San Antonio 1 TaxID=1237626 RepID=W6ZTI5_9APIC|nr:hypothetical protein C922_05401 [Plasmodium inui San Antonio 1]EUD64222.1 hypothetical protein C922_05401 [Plasmodium inui San Antonio 1]